MKHTALTSATLTRLESLIDCSRFSAEQAEKIEHLAYCANMGADSSDHAWERCTSLMFDYFEMVLDGAKITLAEAEAAGYERADQTWERGYISRKQEPGAALVHVAGGTRAGELYACLPSWKSSRYFRRVYLRKKGA